MFYNKFSFSICLGLFSLFIHIPFVISQQSCLDLNEKYGQYTVGFQTIYTYDKSRSFSANLDQNGNLNPDLIFRPMQVCIWYPAKESRQNQMLYEDYFFLKAHETGEVPLTEERKISTIEEFLNSDPVDEARFWAEMKLPVKAKLEAIPVDGNFPVLIYGPSWWSTAFENALLFEFLASHGYVVLSSPSLGPENREMPLSAIGMETQARDMEFLLTIADDFPNADIDHLAVAGFSWGGLANVVMASRHIGVDAWIGLDPSVHEAYNFFEETPYDEYSQFTMPTLFINTASYINDMPFYDRLVYSNAYVLNLPELDHTDLASQFIQLMQWSTDDQALHQNKTKGYNLMCRASLAFLQSVFEQNEGQNSWFSSLQEDDEFVRLIMKEALPLPEKFIQLYQQDEPDWHQFLFGNESGQVSRYPESDLQDILYLAIQKQLDPLSNKIISWVKDVRPTSFLNQASQWMNSDQLKLMYSTIYETNQPCTFGYDEINHTAHILFMRDDGETGIEYFLLNEKLHSSNYKAQFNLGLGYYWLERFDEAEAHFEKCLTLEPDERYRGMAANFLSKM